MNEHPVIQLIPTMDRGRYAELYLDIKAHGQKVPCLVWRGQLIDGRHRLKACRELGMEPRFETIECPEEELLPLVWSLNVMRRQLTNSQRAMIAAAATRYSERGRPKTLPQTGKNVDLSTTSTELPNPGAEKMDINTHFSESVPKANTAKVAARYGVSRDYVEKAKVVLNTDETLAHRVHTGEMTVSKALKEIKRRKVPPKVEPARDQPNLVHRDHLKQALEITVRLESLLVSITQYSRPPVPDEEAWGREVELKQRLTALCAMIPKLCINEVGESWSELGNTREVHDT
jgi:ParB-like nuclease domain